LSNCDTDMIDLGSKHAAELLKEALLEGNDGAICQHPGCLNVLMVLWIVCGNLHCLGKHYQWEIFGARNINKLGVVLVVGIHYHL
jgi:hypothetical protein